MISKSNKVLLITSFACFMTITVFLIYIINKDSNSLESKSGKYYSKMHILNQNNNKSFEWDVSICNEDVKRGVVENEFNKESLKKFTKVINDMKSTKVSLFLLITYLIYLLIILAIATKDAHMGEKDKKSLQLIFIFLIIFLIYQIANHFIEYNKLCRYAVNYFNLIK